MLPQFTARRFSVSLLAVLAAGSITYGQNPPALFRSIPPSRAPQARAPETAVKRSRAVEVVRGVVDGQAAERILATGSVRKHEMLLNVFPDIELKAGLGRVELSDDGKTIIWTGKVKGSKYGEMVLAVTGNIVSGTISTDNARYLVRHAEGDVHWILEADGSKLPPEGQPIPVSPSDLPPEQARDTALPDDGSTVDVMVVYTPAVRNALGGLTQTQNLIQLGIAETNQGYANSGITQRVRLVHSVEVSYTESGSFNTDLNRLTSTNDSYMDQVHTLRDTYAADVVSLWVNSGDACGLAWLMTSTTSSFAARAFNVVRRDCATGYYSFGHEMGHNMGATHDRTNSGGPGLYGYSYGYQQKNNAPYFRTVMAYQCSGADCPRVNYWSNPEVNYSGFPTGINSSSANSADNRLTLNNSRNQAANWRQSAGTSLSISPTSASVPAAGGTGSITVTATAGFGWTASTVQTWITITAGSSGSGNGTVSYSVAANSLSSSRSGTITIGTQPFTITQSGVTTGTCTPTPITIGATVNGALQDGDCISPFRTGSVRADRYTFQGTAGQQIAIEMNSTAIDSYLYLLGTNGTQLTFDDDGGAQGFDSRIPPVSGYYTLPGTGLYTIEATAFSSSSAAGAYTLKLLSSASSCTSFSISPTSRSLDANLNTGTFDVTAGAGCTWTAFSNSPSWVFLTSSGNGVGPGSVAYQVQANQSTSARSGSITAAGQTYTINQAGASGCSVGSITPGQTINSSLESTDCRALFRAGDYYSERYTFSGTAGQQVAIELSSAAFDTYLYLLGPSGTIVAQDDDGGDGLNSRIPPGSGFFTLATTGTYTIEATSFASQRTGAFTLRLLSSSCSISLNPPGALLNSSGGTGSIGVSAGAGCSWSASSNASWATVTSGSSGSGSGTINYSVTANTSSTPRAAYIEVGGLSFGIIQMGAGCTVSTIGTSQTVSGALNTGGCRSVTAGSGYYSSYYAFTGAAGQQIAIGMTSSAFDTYLYLISPSQLIIGEDDDGGAGTNSRIPPDTGFVILPASGTYLIEATSYATLATGAFTLTTQSGGGGGGEQRATMTSPTPGSTFTSTSVTFNWTSGIGASRYWLDVGNSAGSGDISNGETTSTSRTVSNLPCDGRTIYVRLWTFIGASWQSPLDYTYRACTTGGDPRATMSSPAPGSTLSSTSVTFSWTPGAGATRYWLDVGSSVGSGSISAGETTATSRTVSNLPCDGRTIYVRLWTFIGSWQSPLDYTYRACTTGGDPRAAISSPTPGSTFTSNSVTFTWTPGTGATRYWLDVGNAVGSGDIFGGETTSTSRTVNVPTDGRTIYVRLWTFIGSWQSPLDYTYRACSGFCGGSEPRATMTSPTPGSTLTAGSVTFTWTAGSGVTQYWLDVGNSLGSGDIAAGATSATSRTVNVPTDGRQIYVRLWSMIGGVWQTPFDYLYRACSGCGAGQARAEMISPAPGSTFSSPAVTFNWTTGAGASQYWLDVGNSVGSGDISAGATTLTSRTVNVPTDGRNVYVRLWTMIGGVWQSPLDYTYRACSGCGGGDPRAMMQAPPPGSLLTSSTVTFTWSPGTGASAYWLDVGTGVGAGNISAGATSTTSRTVSGIPINGGTIYVRLWTMIGGAWQTPIDYTYRTQ